MKCLPCARWWSKCFMSSLVGHLASSPHRQVLLLFPFWYMTGALYNSFCNVVDCLTLLHVWVIWNPLESWKKMLAFSSPNWTSLRILHAFWTDYGPQNLASEFPKFNAFATQVQLCPFRAQVPKTVSMYEREEQWLPSFYSMSKTFPFSHNKIWKAEYQR